jgi:hypothetical protein
MKLSRRAVAVLVLHAFVLQPALAAAQAVKAGVVTTVEGNVTARRVVLPAPVPLKFKDDVFLQDNITTGDQSFARFLLGGKAVVTVRERSRLTITEIPGRSEVNIEGGKIGMAVARDRMRPGEVINIRTPNAIVAVRGTVLVVEVSQATAQAGGAVGGGVTTDVFLLKDNVDVTHVDPATSRAIGSPHFLTMMQRFTAVGAALPKISAITPDMLGGIQAGLSGRGGVGGGNGAGSQEQAKAQVIEATNAVLAAVTGTGDTQLIQAPALPATTLVQEQGPPDVPLITIPDDTTIDELIPSGGESTPPLPPLPPLPPPPIVEDLPEILVQNESLDLPPGQALRVFTTVESRDKVSPFARILDSEVTTSGTGDLFRVANGAEVTLNSLLLDVVDSTIDVARNLLRVNGILFGFNPSGLIAIDPSTIHSAVELIRVGPNGFLATAGPLLIALDSTLDVDNQLLHVLGDGGPNPGIVVAGGRLLEFVRTILDLESNLVRLFDGGSVVGGGGGVPLVLLQDSTYGGGIAPGAVSGGSLLRMFSQVGRAGSVLAILGPYLSAVDSEITARDAPLFNINDGASIFSLATDAFASFLRSAVSVPTSFVNIETNTSFTPPGQETVVGSGEAVEIVLNGSLIDARQTDFDILGAFLRLQNEVDFTQLGPSPTIRVEGASAAARARVDTSGNFFQMTAAAGRPAPVMTISAALLEAINAELFTGDPTINTATFSFISDGAHLETTGGDYLFKFTNSAVDTAGNILTARGSPRGLPTIVLAGRLLFGQDSTFNTTSRGGVGACCSGFFIGEGAQLTINDPGAATRLVNSIFSSGPDGQSGGTFFHVTDATNTGTIVAPASVVLAGTLLSMLDSTVTSLFSMNNVTRSTFTSSSPNALVEAVGSIIQAGGFDPFTETTTRAWFLLVVASASNGVDGAAATVSLAGPLALLTGAGSNVTLTADVLGVFNGAQFSSTTSAVLIQLVDVVLNAGTATSAFEGRVLHLSGVGGPSGNNRAKVTLDGGLFRATNGLLNLRRGLIGVFAGGELTVNGSGDPVAHIVGGTGSHLLATNASSSMVDLQGRGDHLMETTLDDVTVEHGSDRAVQAAGGAPLARTLVQFDNATVTTNRLARFDQVLFEATAPIFRVNNSTVNSNNATHPNAIDLSFKAKVTSLGPIMALNGATVNVHNGHALNLNHSLMQVNGDLFSLGNGSLLNVVNGALVRVGPGSVLNVSGALAAFFGAGNNRIQVAGGGCDGACPTIHGIPYLLVNGATLNTNLNVGPNPLKNSHLGSLVSVGGNSPAIIVDGSGGSKATITAP